MCRFKEYVFRFFPFLSFCFFWGGGGIWGPNMVLKLIQYFLNMVLQLFHMVPNVFPPQSPSAASAQVPCQGANKLEKDILMMSFSDLPEYIFYIWILMFWRGTIEMRF